MLAAAATRYALPRTDRRSASDGGSGSGSWTQAGSVAVWPRSRSELIAIQVELGAADPPPWSVSSAEAAGEPLCVASCFVCFGRDRSGPGEAGEPAWVAAVAYRGERQVAHAVLTTTAGAPYEPGLLALREGPLLDAAVRSVRQNAKPDVLVVNATGRDHPRRAGLAVHLGHVLGLPSVGVTHRPLYATGAWPHDVRGAASPLMLDGEVVGCWVRTRPGRRPLAVHAGWRVDPGCAVDVIRAALMRTRTPEPLRAARRLARLARTRALTAP